MPSPTAGHGQLTIDGQLVVHLEPEELSVLITACTLALSTLESAGIDMEPGSLSTLIQAASKRLAEVLR